MKKYSIFVFLCILFLGTFIFLKNIYAIDQTKDEKTTISAAKSLENDFIEIASKIKPSVVNISAVKIIKENKFNSFPEQNKDEFEDFFKKFFGERPYSQQPQEHQENSLGSGVIINEKGYILTNYHVIANANEIKVILSDKEKYDAEIMGKDKETDLAVIKIKNKEGKKFPVVKLGDSDKIQVGQWVLAIGNPFGLEKTVTAGIISATGRVIGSGPYDNFIQTDASINPGNSGGPLLNLAGEVIGINTAITSPTGSSIGLGFAIPINEAKDILDDLIEHGEVTRGCLGITLQTITSELASKFGIDEKADGVIVSDVFEGYPAEKAGIKVGDILIEYDNQPVKDGKQLQFFVAKTKIDKEVKLGILRKGKKIVLICKIAKMPKNFHKIGKQAHPSDVEVKEMFGLEVQEITKELAEKFDIKNTKGVIISSVSQNSFSEKSGFLRQDIIRKIEDTEITNLADYKEAIEKIKKGENVLFFIERQKSTLFIVLETKEK
ncbi:MAG: Do family serine endopeptidase [bacterium]